MTFKNLSKFWKVLFTSVFLRHELSVLLNNFPPGTCQMYYPPWQSKSFISARSSWNVWISTSLTDRSWTGQGDQRISNRQITGRLIPQVLRLQAQVKLASLGWRHKSRKCANFVHVDPCISAVRVLEVPVLVCFRSSCNHKSCQVIWLGLCGCNTAILCVGLYESCDV